MRRADHVEMQTPLPLRRNIELGMNEQAVQVGIADDLLLDRVPALRIGIGYPESQGSGVDQLGFANGVPPFVVEEGLTVADHVLQVANLRHIDGGIVDLSVDAVG